jgi:hypothetical protein
VANGKPRLKDPEKVALASALIALGLDQAICEPVESSTLYLVPDGLLPVGDVHSTVDRSRQEFVSLYYDADESRDWQAHINRKRIQYEGFPAYPIDKKKLDKWLQKKRKK